MSLAVSLIRQWASLVTSWITSTDDSNWVIVQNTKTMLEEFNSLVETGMDPKDALAQVKANAKIQNRISDKED